MEFVIHTMRPEDMEGKANVHFQSWQETYQGLIDQDFLDSRTLEKCVEAARRWPDNTLVAEADGKIVGFAAYGKYRNDDLANCGEVGAIYVLREYHRRGIGYALMNACVEKLRDNPMIAVWVLRGNDTAIRFYERYGFRFDGASEEIMLGTPNVQMRMVYRR